MNLSRRQPKRGEWILIDGYSTVAKCMSISRSSVYPTLWLRQKGAERDFPHGLVGGKQDGHYDFAILPSKPTHRVTFRRNIYFRGFSFLDMTRDVILVNTPMEGDDGVVILIDWMLMRKDAVLMLDVVEMIEIKEEQG